MRRVFAVGLLLPLAVVAAGISERGTYLGALLAAALLVATVALSPGERRRP